MVEQSANRVKLLPRPSYQRIRIEPTIRYQWKGVFENYAKAYIARNLWRVRTACGDSEDALQEAAFTFVCVVRKYGDVVDNPAWMMALYKRALENAFIDMANKDTKLRNLPAETIDTQTDCNGGMLASAIAEGSDELRKFLSVIADAPSDFLSILLTGFGEVDDEILNRRIHRLLGIKHSAVNVVAELRAIVS